MGPVADTAVNVSAKAIKDDPALIKKLVRAVYRGLRYTHDHPEELFAMAKKEFPTMGETDLKAALKRATEDQVWSVDGFIPREAWKTSLDVVRKPGLLKRDVGYDEVIDMQFNNAVRAEMKTK